MGLRGRLQPSDIRGSDSPKGTKIHHLNGEEETERLVQMGAYVCLYVLG